MWIGYLLERYHPIILPCQKFMAHTEECTSVEFFNLIVLKKITVNKAVKIVIIKKIAFQMSVFTL